MTMVCRNCWTRVIPMADGRCPSCIQAFVEASAEESEQADARRQEQQTLREEARKKSAGNGRRDMAVDPGNRRLVEQRGERPHPEQPEVLAERQAVDLPIEHEALDEPLSSGEERGQWLAAGFQTDKPKIKYGFAPFPQVQTPTTLYDSVGICTPQYTNRYSSHFGHW